MEPLVVGTGIEQVAKDYDIFLLDMWGVMHDGSRPYEGVIDTVKKLKEAGKEMIILSNSSKRQEKSLKMLAKLGFDPINDFSQVITSGDVSTDTKHMHTPSYLRYRTMYLLAQNLISPL
jgi:ribonucleotide monophosphatase NagD (HAD superfamily)